MAKRLWLIIFVCLILVTVPFGALFWFYETNLARTEGEYFDSDGVKIHYTVEGSGEPVVLVHGFAFNADLNWRSPGVIAALSKKYKVIALDNRGHGLSEKPLDANAYGEKMPGDIIRLMDHLRIDKAHVVGYSMGGFITLKLITMYPERLLSAAPCGMGWAEMTEENKALIERIASSLEEGKGFGPLLEKLNIKENHRGELVGRAFNYLLSTMNNTQALAHAMRGMGGLVVTEQQLRANQVPTLSIVGLDDPLAENAPPLHDIMGNHELAYLDHADHVTALQHADFIPQVMKFLEAHPAGSWAFDAQKYAAALASAETEHAVKVSDAQALPGAA